ncbi:Multidrug resistance protein D [Morganella morganii]|nr:Multidrug resistance protein D [Morganella morganii]
MWIPGLLGVMNVWTLLIPAALFFFGAGMLFPLATTAAMEPFPYLAGGCGCAGGRIAECGLWCCHLDFRTDAAGRTGQCRSADAGGLCDYGVVLAASGSPVAESAADGILSQTADIRKRAQ